MHSWAQLYGNADKLCTFHSRLKKCFSPFPFIPPSQSSWGSVDTVMHCQYVQVLVVLQVGGSDQMGNILAGMDLIRRKADSESSPVYGLVFPLLTTSDGVKMGKSVDGAVWLEAS